MSQGANPQYERGPDQCNPTDHDRHRQRAIVGAEGEEGWESRLQHGTRGISDNIDTGEEDILKRRREGKLGKQSDAGGFQFWQWIGPLCTPCALLMCSICPPNRPLAFSSSLVHAELRPEHTTWPKKIPRALRSTPYLVMGREIYVDSTRTHLERL